MEAEIQGQIHKGLREREMTVDITWLQVTVFNQLAAATQIT